jgi:hypothetical protein
MTSIVSISALGLTRVADGDVPDVVAGSCAHAGTVEHASNVSVKAAVPPLVTIAAEYSGIRMLTYRGLAVVQGSRCSSP